uniref:Reverse transcriptase domain-containing protein n=1 Tax=Tanacetum cinerariifolium TaxID=118510 RepID=A0A699GKW5_TANCI|nr:reverse transcriptase domain-containing protein [Tanacetum cinerariifolium]
MSTRSSARNLFPPLDNPELTIRRRSCADPTLLNDFEMATEGNDDPPVLDLRTMKELCQPSLNGRGGPIAPIAIQATNFRLKNDMIQQVQNSCQFHGLSSDDANNHLDKFLHVTQSIKVNGITYNNPTMSSSNHPTSNIEDAFSSNFPDYTTALPNYFPASPGNISLDPPDNLSKYLFASLAISPFHNEQAYNVVANKLPIPPQDPIPPPTILTPSPVLPPSPLFDPRHFLVLEELLPPKKKIHPPSSSSTTLSNSSRKQACILVLPSFLPYTPIPPQIYELGKSFIKMRVKHHEEQVESILCYLEELSFHYIEKMEERLVNGWIIIPRDLDEVKTKLKEARTQIRELQKKCMGQRNKISFIHFRISDLEMTLEDIQDRHQLYVKNHMGHTS